MKKVALVFVVAVITPSLVLAWLAVRSLRDQQLALERQQTLLCQGVADAAAKRVQDAVDAKRASFHWQVAALLQDKPARSLANQFDPELRKVWPLAEVGFAVSLDPTASQIIAPSPFDGSEARRFRVENDRFLCSSESVEVYWNGPKGAINLSKLDQKEAMNDAKSGKPARTVAPEKESSTEPLASKVTPEAAAFRQIVGNSGSGALARFLQDRLNVLFWTRSPVDTQLVFGAQVNVAKLTDDLVGALALEEALRSQIVVALLNDSGRPVALSPPLFETPHGEVRARFGTEAKLLASNQKRNVAPSIYATRPKPDDLSAAHKAELNWRRPFVATEIGDVLPHWEVAVYLLDPGQLTRSARSLRLTLLLLIAVLVLAIAIGSWLIVADMKRQLMLARQKTDFVSNVSHELKTPLTSIRMFSEMLAEGRVKDDAKRRQFLSIITAEAARLTRLINNVLDFARLERGEKKYQFTPCDLTALARETLESYRPNLEAAGFRLTARFPEAPISINGDRDALAQVMVNLLSNAEKYSGDGKEIESELAVRDGSVEFAVLDRGSGVPKVCEEKIFEQFYRAHDSLASGIQGSGLGLTLARQIARAHGGDVEYQPREGGGSRFTLRLPVKA